MAKKQHSVFEVECTRCGIVLGTVSSNKKASVLMETHERNVHGFTDKVFETVSRPENVGNVYDLISSKKFSSDPLSLKKWGRYD